MQRDTGGISMTGFEKILRKMASDLPAGERPSPLDPPSGCVFSTRCAYAFDRCRTERPAPRPVGGRSVACHIAEQFLEGASPPAPRTGP